MGSRSALRYDALIRSGRRCFWCDRVLHPDWAGRKRGVPPPPHALTLDRLIPGCQGGLYTLLNVVASCVKCNSERGSIPAPVFLIMKRHPEIAAIAPMLEYDDEA